MLAMPGISRAANMRTLRFVPQADLSILDPVYTTVAVTIEH
jgi:peptide/nickel transport system substrate-binding protein